MLNLKHLQGKFIALDGGEGCGKSTQARLLRETLEANGIEVLPVHDPGATRIGEMIRGVLLNPENTDMAMRCEMLLYMASRSQMMTEKILPALELGKTVLSDRFISSTLAYQTGGDGLTMDEIRAVGNIAVNGRLPDLTIILDLPIEISQTRVRPKFVLFPTDKTEKNEGAQANGEKDRIELRSPEYHNQVRRRYIDQVKDSPERHRLLDASADVTTVHNSILKTLENFRF